MKGTLEEELELYRDLLGICGLDPQREYMIISFHEKVKEKYPDFDDDKIVPIYDMFLEMIGEVEIVMNEHDKTKEDFYSTLGEYSK